MIAIDFTSSFIHLQKKLIQIMYYGSFIFLATTAVTATTTTTTTPHYAVRMMVPLCQKQKCRKKSYFSISVFCEPDRAPNVSFKNKKKKIFFL
jgi:hypothetical protein